MNHSVTIMHHYLNHHANDESVDLEANRITYYNTSDNNVMDSTAPPHSKTNNKNMLLTLYDFAIEKYGPSFTSVIKTIIPILQNDANVTKQLNTEEYMNYVLFNIDVELGYTKKELEIMNDPLLEFVSTIHPNSQCQNNKKEDDELFSHRIYSVLEIFYKEINE